MTLAFGVSFIISARFYNSGQSKYVTYLFLIQDVCTGRPFWRLSPIDSILDFGHSFWKFFVRKWLLHLSFKGFCCILFYCFFLDLFGLGLLNYLFRALFLHLNFRLLLFVFNRVFFRGRNFNRSSLPFLVRHVRKINDTGLPIVSMHLILLIILLKVLLLVLKSLHVLVHFSVFLRRRYNILFKLRR